MIMVGSRGASPCSLLLLLICVCVLKDTLCLQPSCEETEVMGVVGGRCCAKAGLALLALISGFTELTVIWYSQAGTCNLLPQGALVVCLICLPMEVAWQVKTPSPASTPDESEGDDW